MVVLGPVLVVVVGGAVAQPVGLQQHTRRPDPYVELHNVVLTAPWHMLLDERGWVAACSA